MPTVEQALAATLRALRQQSGFSQSYVANQIGTSQPSVSNWEEATRIPSPETLYSLSNIYNTTPAEIYTKSETNEMQERAKRLEQNIINKKREKKNGNHKNKK